MKNFKIKAIIMLILFSVFLCILPKGVNTTNRIFILDISGSMRKGGLFDRIKETLTRDYISKMEIGEYVLILTFDKEVVPIINRKIETPEDINRINSIINNLRATGPWTWMSEAFRKTREYAANLKKQYPTEKLNIYLLTDGINEPPPETHEPPMEFVTILINYFSDFEVKDTYIYLLSYRPLEEDDKEKISIETPIIVVEPSRKRPLSGEVELVFSAFDFGELDISRNGVTRTGQIQVKDLKGETIGKVVHLYCDYPFKVRPESITIEKQGQIEEVSIAIPAGFALGEHTGIIKISSPGIIVSPNQSKFSFSIKKPGFIGVSQLLFLLLTVCLAYGLYTNMIRSKTIWAKREDYEEAKETKIQGWRKTYLKQVALPDYYLRFGILTEIFLAKKGEIQRRKIKYPSPFSCQDSKGYEVILRFYKENPTGKPEIEGKPEEEEPKGGNFLEENG